MPAALDQHQYFIITIPNPVLQHLSAHICTTSHRTLPPTDPPVTTPINIRKMVTEVRIPQPASLAKSRVSACDPPASAKAPSFVTEGTPGTYAD